MKNGLWSIALLLVLTSACTGSPDRQPEAPPADEPPAVLDRTPPDFSRLSYEVQPAGLRRLTEPQYRNAVRTLFGPDIVIPSRLEPDSEIGGLVELGASRTSISRRGVEAYEAASYELAEQAMESGALRARLVPCEPAGAEDAACARQALSGFARIAWRRSLTDAELDRLTTVSTRAGATLGDFHQGLVFGLAAVLQSPKFLFRQELGRATIDGVPAFDDHELATRLSFFLWDDLPDAALLDAAEQGRLTSEDGLAEQVERMLQDPRARRGIRTFFTEILELNHLDEVNKAPEIFPSISPDLAPSAREETLRVIEHLIFEERGDYRDLMTTRRTFLNPKLAALYDVRAPSREGFAEVMLPADGKRLGLLGHASFLALHSHPVSTSPTLRGIFVREKLLCEIIPDPPADVDTSIPEPSGRAPTLRARIDEHLSVQACAGCHGLVDPIGLALENFDGIGRYRELDNGVPIDASGRIAGSEFEGPEDFAQILRTHPSLTTCLVTKMFRYATGRVEIAEGEQELLDTLHDAFAASGYDTLTLVRNIALSPGFRLAAPPRQEDSP